MRFLNVKYVYIVQFVQSNVGHGYCLYRLPTDVTLTSRLLNITCNVTLSFRITPDNSGESTLAEFVYSLINCTYNSPAMYRIFKKLLDIVV